MRNEYSTYEPVGSMLRRRCERGQNEDPLLSVTQDRGVIPQETAGRRNISSPDKSTYWRVYPNDIVYNTMRMWQGASARSNHFGIVSPAYTVCEPNDGVSSKYLAYALKLPEHVALFSSRSQGITSDVWNLRFSELQKINIRVVNDKSCQLRIAEILSTIDEAIEQTEALIAKTQQVKAGLMHDLFTRGVTLDGQLRPLREEAPQLFKESLLGWIPKKWDIKTMSDCAAKAPGSTTIGPFGSNLVASDYRSEGVPVVFVRDVKEDAFEWNSEVYVTPEKALTLAAHAVRPGDIIATKMGLPPCIACRYPEWMPPGIITADIIRLRPDPTAVDIRWLSAALNTDAVRRQVQAITAGVTRPKVTLTDFRTLKVACPDVEEQALIGDRIAIFNSVLDAERACLQKLMKQKQGLMHDLLTGRVRVKVAEPRAVAASV